MKQPKIKTSDQIVKNQHFTILELLDRLLDKGVMVKGEVVLSVADIDLVYLNLGLLLSSVKTVEKAKRRDGNGETSLISWQTSSETRILDEPQIEVGTKGMQASQGNTSEVAEWTPRTVKELASETTVTRTLAKVVDHRIEQMIKPRTNINPKNVEKGLAKLVLTVVDLLRKLMEKQAVRQMEAGFLTAWQIDRVGTSFLLLDERMEQLKKVFGLKDEDLNLDLGPLGELT